MHGGVVHLEAALIRLAVPRIDGRVLALGVVGVHAAYAGEAQPAVALDLGDHAAKGIEMRRKHDGVALAAQAAEHAALIGDLGRIAESLQPFDRIFGGGLGEARGAGDGDELFKLLYNAVHMKTPYFDWIFTTCS